MAYVYPTDCRVLRRMSLRGRGILQSRRIGGPQIGTLSKKQCPGGASARLPRDGNSRFLWEPETGKSCGGFRGKISLDPPFVADRQDFICDLRVIRLASLTSVQGFIRFGQTGTLPVDDHIFVVLPDL